MVGHGGNFCSSSIPRNLLSSPNHSSNPGYPGCILRQANQNKLDAHRRKTNVATECNATTHKANLATNTQGAGLLDSQEPDTGEAHQCSREEKLEERGKKNLIHYRGYQDFQNKTGSVQENTVQILTRM